MSFNEHSLPAPQDFVSLFALIALISDPEASRKRLEELYGAQKDAQHFIAAAENCRQLIEGERRNFEDELRTRQEEHDRALAESKDKMDAHCQNAMSEVRTRLDNVKRLETQAMVDADAAAILKINLQQRVDKIKSAVA